MSINLRDYKYFTITDLSGGENQFASSYKVADNELVATKNMSFKDSGGIRVRQGDKLLDVGNVSNVSAGITGMHRYTSSFGGRNTIMYTSDGYIWIDNDGPNEFTRVPSSEEQKILSNDGRCRFTQHWDTVIFGTDRDGLYLYNPNVSTIEIPKLSVSSYVPYTIAGVSIYTSGGAIEAGDAPPTYYYYRLTYDYQYGDFIGESGPHSGDNYGNRINYPTSEATISDPGNANRVELWRALPTAEDLPSNIARVNVYRSNPRSSSITNSFEKVIECFWIGSIDAATYNNAAFGDTVFTDGGRTPDYTLQYNKMDEAPRGRYLTIHKGRLWLANVQYRLGNIAVWKNDKNAQVGDYEKYPHRVFISSIGGVGVFEPGIFYTDQFVDVDPRGSGITGIWSYHNNVLVVFKANSMYAVTGDDPHPESGNISVRNISNTVGCIAPESIVEVEGRLVWLSNSGMYYWDGGSKPAPLKTDNIVDTIQGISDATKSKVVSVYDRKQREMLMAFSDPTSGGYNRKIAKFDVRTSAWSIDEYGIGYGGFVTTDEPAESSKVYGGFNDTGGSRIFLGSIGQLNTGSAANAFWVKPVGQTPGFWSGSDINFEFQTKFYDGGLPFMDKNFVAISIDLKTSEELTLHVLCDNRLDTRSDDTGFTISLPAQSALVWAGSGGTGEPTSRRWYNDTTDDPPAQILNDNRWASVERGTTIVSLNSRCWGKRISLIVSGAVQDEVSIDSITVFYKPLEGVREN